MLYCICKACIKYPFYTSKALSACQSSFLTLGWLTWRGQGLNSAPLNGWLLSLYSSVITSAFLQHPPAVLFTLFTLFTPATNYFYSATCINKLCCSVFCISGVFGENWNVTYETESICALKGSTVNMSCSYTYPQQYDLTDTFWIRCQM